MGECFEQEIIFPIIQGVIRSLCANKASHVSSADQTFSFALHHEIAAALLTHPQGAIEIQAALQRCPQHTAPWIADNMVQWWSQRYTIHRNEWSALFQRKRIHGNWAYKPQPLAEDIYSKSVLLSRKIWPILIDLAAIRQTITYKELGNRLQIHGQALQNFARILAPIKYYCIHHTLPPLSALVVYTGTGTPGSGADADESDIAQIFLYDWKNRKPLIPSEEEFAYAIRIASMESSREHTG